MINAFLSFAFFCAFRGESLSKSSLQPVNANKILYCNEADYFCAPTIIWEILMTLTMN